MTFQSKNDPPSPKEISLSGKLTRMVTLSLWVAGIIWTLLCVGGLIYQIYSLRLQAFELATAQAKERYHSQELILTNPALMTSEIHQMSKGHLNLGHVTSLTPLNPANAPDPWERNALFQFEAGEKEVLTSMTVGGEEYIRYMRPLLFKKECLQCHGATEKDIGTIRGGLSVMVPISPARAVTRSQVTSLVIGYPLVWLVGLLGLLLAGRSLTRQVSRNEKIQIRLLESEKRAHILAQAIEQSPTSVTITDLESRIEYVNRAFCESSGYDESEVIGQRISMLKSGRTPAATYAALWRMLALGLPWRGEFWNRKKDGSEIVEFSTVSPLHDEQGRVVNYVASQEDVTEKKLLGMELDKHRHHLEELVDERTREVEEARLKAEEANRSKTRFLSNMSHEIRTPMNAILGLTHLLRETELDDSQYERLEKIDNAASHLLSIINDILDISKIEAGKVTLESKVFPLDELLESITEFFRADVEAKNINLEIETHHAPLWLKGDRLRLRKALTNYLSNAIKFTKNGGIKLRSIIKSVTDTQVRMRFEVEDTGIGIPPDKLQNLFSSFTQADESTTRKFGGTGLGLAITRNIATLLGGETGAESKPGQGSMFWLTAEFELAEAPENLHQEAAIIKDTTRTEISSLASGRSVLLVDDNEINLEVGSELLQRVGFRVVQAENGRIAVEKAKADKFSLILMDIQMPEMDGIEATGLIRASDGYATTPILAMTADVFRDHHQSSSYPGMDDVIAKPVDPEQLYAILAKWLRISELTDEETPETESVEGSQRVEEKNEETGNDDQILDADALVKMFGNDQTQHLRILQKFLPQMDDVYAKIEQGYNEHISSDIAFNAHKLKSSSKLIGANQLSALCLVLELAGKGENWELINEEYPKLKEVAYRLRQRIEQISAEES